MKYILITIAVIIVGIVVFKLIATKPPQDLPQVTTQEVTDTATSTTTVPTSTSTAQQGQRVETTFNFTGYGPGKSHLGTFTDIKNNITVVNGKPAAGSVTINASTVSTGIAALDKHLCSDDFFDCVKYPTISFDLTKFTDTSAEGTINFRGVKKAVTIPLTVKDGVYTADFRIDVTPFTFKYLGIDKEVRIQFTAAVK